MRILFGDKPVLDRVQEAENLARLGLPVPPQFARANSLLNPLGRAPARGWLLMLRRDLEELDLNALHDLTLDSDDPLLGAARARGLVVCREPECLTPGWKRDADACYLVEVADARWRVYNPHYVVPAQKQYNVRAPAYAVGSGPDVYYQDTLDGGGPWTWARMCEDLWGAMPQLGPWPGFPLVPDPLNPQGPTVPYEPNGLPEGWAFPGVAAWPALCDALWKVGLAVRWDPQYGRYHVVRVGGVPAPAPQPGQPPPRDDDPSTDDRLHEEFLRLAEQDGRKILDADFLPALRGRVPYGVKVLFHKVWVHHGSQETVTRTPDQWQTQAVGYIDVTGPEPERSEPDVYHPLWDDLPALCDADGLVTNLAACQARAQERANDYYRELLAGGARRRLVFSGVVAVVPTGLIRGVAWRQDAQGALVTEVVRHPFRLLAADDDGRWQELPDPNSPLQPPAFGPGRPDYPPLVQTVRIPDGAAPDADGYYGCYVQRYDPDRRAWSDREPAWVFDANG
jgi:hypothetical protein